MLSFPRFHVATDLTTVTFENVALSLAVSCGAAWAHAVAWTHVLCAPTIAVERVSAGANPSLARERLAGPWPPSSPATRVKIRIVRDADPQRADGFGPPYAMCQGRRLPFDVSLSHDGAFVACAQRGLEGKRSPA